MRLRFTVTCLGGNYADDPGAGTGLDAAAQSQYQMNLAGDEPEPIIDAALEASGEGQSSFANPLATIYSVPDLVSSGVAGHAIFYQRPHQRLDADDVSQLAGTVTQVARGHRDGKQMGNTDLATDNPSQTYYHKWGAAPGYWDADGGGVPKPHTYAENAQLVAMSLRDESAFFVPDVTVDYLTAMVVRLVDRDPYKFNP